MTGRERLIAALNRKPVDRIPWSLCMDAYYTSSLVEQGFSMNLLETLRYLRNDIMERHVPTYQTIYKNLSYEEQKSPEEWTRFFHTPVGDLTEISRSKGHTHYIAKHLITSYEDLKTFLYVLKNTEYQPDFAYFIKRDHEIGEDGMATPTAPYTPIQAFLQHLIGVENTVYFLADYPDLMDEILELLHERNKEAYKIIRDCPTPVIFAYEDTSTTVMSRWMYEKYCSKQIDEYADIIHNSGKIFITHMCGKLKGFADLVKAGKQDGVDSLCPPTTGDFWAHEARACWGEEKVIIGGLEPPILVRLTEEETIRYTVRVINQMAPGNSFILSSGDAVSYGTPIENLLAITRLIEEYGSYPLTGTIDEDEAVARLCK
ncbi:MAG: uroporphyrinogen decarboxylase family protein [Massiliimalia sp.]|jgi:hypothetical protein